MHIKSVDMTEEIMDKLEQLNLIIRLTPKAHRFSVKEGAVEDRVIYNSDSKYGPHKLISVVIDRRSFSSFGAHADNEEFLLIGSNDDKPLYLLISYLKMDELKEKIESDTVTSDDFVCLRCKFNDPELSFFTMLKGVPHGEATCTGAEISPKFYVTEPADMGITLLDLSKCDIIVD